MGTLFGVLEVTVVDGATVSTTELLLMRLLSNVLLMSLRDASLIRSGDFDAQPLCVILNSWNNFWNLAKKTKRCHRVPLSSSIILYHPLLSLCRPQESNREHREPPDDTEFPTRPQPSGGLSISISISIISVYIDHIGLYLSISWWQLHTVCFIYGLFLSPVP